jgi:hypothetical protein
MSATKISTVNRALARIKRLGMEVTVTPTAA